MPLPRLDRDAPKAPAASRRQPLRRIHPRLAGARHPAYGNHLVRLTTSPSAKVDHDWDRHSLLWETSVQTTRGPHLPRAQGHTPTTLAYHADPYHRLGCPEYLGYGGTAGRRGA